jgi:hypothetical protein
LLDILFLPFSLFLPRSMPHKSRSVNAVREPQRRAVISISTSLLGRE